MLIAWLPMGEMCIEVTLEMYGLWAYKHLYGQCGGVHGEEYLLYIQAAWSAHCRGALANMLLGQGQASARRLEVDDSRSIETAVQSDGLSDGPYCYELANITHQIFDTWNIECRSESATLIVVGDI